MPRKLAALGRLGVSLEQLAVFPNITGLMVALNKSEKIVEVMRFSEEPALRKVLSAYDSCPVGDRAFIPFEAFAIKAQVNTNELIGGIIMAYRATQSQKSALRVMDAHPQVVDKTIKYALERKGDKDRRMLHEAVSFVPTSKGTTFNVNLPSNQAPQMIEEKRESLDVQDEEGINDVFRPVTNIQLEWQDAKNKLLKDEN